ncbi:MAG: glycosyltransferase, partial [Alphaproteobacteria bacterium]|nr:glycosyltransferase [Alphaproteobacteria bacterium]
SKNAILVFKRSGTMMDAKRDNGKALCLNMIVKNEMANLERCLASVAPHISCWVIGDTGSSDGTQEFIQSFFASRSIPGELHSFKFHNFEQARNEALRLARASKLHFDYLLLMDADMEMWVNNPGFSQNLTAAAYRVLQRSGISYWNRRLLRRNAPARYKGVTHEILDIQAGIENLTGIGFIDHGTGSNRASKYERDIRLLRNAIPTERDPVMIARYSFYLANSLRDAGQKESALEAYLKRSRLGHWQEEVFISLLNVAHLKLELGHPSEDVITAYTKATAALPTRAEALHGAARFCRNRSMHEQGYDFATKGLAVTYPSNGLFVQDWIYEYGLLDELGPVFR